MALSIGELVGYLRLDSSGFDKGVTSAQRSLDLTGKSATKMGESVDKSGAALKNAGHNAETASAASGKLRAAQLSVVAAQERYNALMAEGSGNTARLASSEAALIRSQQRLAAMKPPADPGGMEKLHTGALGAIETVGKLGVTLGVFELAMKGIELVKAGNEFTVALNGVAAASQGSDEQMAKARATAIALGKDLTVPKATAIDAAVAMDDLVKAGVSLDRAMVAARPALLLAAAAQVSIADASRVTGDVMDDFHLKADQAAHVANVLAAASNSAGGGLMDLFDGMKYAGPTARTLGLDVTTTAAALVELAKSGMQGSLGGTAFSNMLAKLNPQAKLGKESLHDLGVTAFDANGKFVGLPKVFDQLHSAMQRMNPQQFSAAVQNAFGARAKNAVYNFATGGAAAFDEFYKKMQAGNVQEYANKMNRGLTAAGAQLKKEVTSWAIDLNDKFSPALARAAFAVGDHLPGAIAQLQHTLQPLEQELTGALIPTWHATTDVLGLAGQELGTVAHILDEHRGTVQIVGTVVLGMWAAWKGYTVAKTAVQAVSEVVDTLRLKGMMAKDAVAGIGSGTSSISAGTLALGGLGLALGVAAYAWQKHAAAVAASKQEVSDFTVAIQQDSGALGDNTKAAVFNALQKAGAIDAAKKFGLSLSDVTDASIGNAAALSRVNGVLNDWKSAANDSGAAADNVSSGADNGADAYYKLRDAVDGTNSKIKQATTGYNDQQAALGKTKSAATDAAAGQKALATSLVYTVDASGNLVQSQQTVGGTVNDTTQELVKQKTASDLLKGSLDALNGVNVTQEQTTNAFLDSLNALSSSVKTNGSSLDQNTAKGRANREQIVSIIEAAKAQAQATADTAGKTMSQTDALKVGNAQLMRNETSIRSQAHSLGLSKDATDRLIRSLGAVAMIKPVATVEAKTGPALTAAQSLQKQIDSIKQGHPVVLGAKSDAGRAEVGELQKRINSIAQGRVPGLDADSKAGRAEITRLQGKIDAIRQGRAVGLDANSAGARAKIADLQRHIDAIRQGRPVGLDASPAAALAKIAGLQGQINRIRQGRVPGLDADSSAGQRKIADLQAQIDGLRGKTISVNVETNGSGISHVASQIAGIGVSGGRAVANAAGTGSGGLADGWFTMNEQGWELGHKQGGRVDIFSHEESKKMLPEGPSVRATVPGYAGGTAKAPAPVHLNLVSTTGGGAAYGIAGYLRGQVPSVRLAARDLSIAVNDAFQLKGVQAKIAAIQADLASVATAKAQFQGNVTSSLLGGIDVTKYGDIASLKATLDNRTGVNNQFAAEQAKLGKEGVPSALIQLLAANGPNAGLDTLANASKRDLASVLKSYGAFSSSAARGGGIAAQSAFGAQITADRRRLASEQAIAARLDTSITRLVLAIAQMTNQPVRIELDGKTVATTKFVNKRLAGVVDEITHHLITGRKH